MRKAFLLGGCLMAVSTAFAAGPAEVDTVSIRKLQEAQVTSTRASNKTPIAFTTLRKSEIQKINFGKDVPSLLSTTPSVLYSSDAGMGVGYTGLRVRGTDASRINVTANGIPINDAESNQVYWVNMPDFASNLSSIQIQRGIGTSTNGSGAFGATVNMLTDGIKSEPFMRFDGSAGSYGTHKETLSFGTGLLGGHWGLSGRLSNLGSDGYIRRASTKLNSYFVQAGYFGDRTVVKFITFNGKEKTYHAWDYATREQIQTLGRRYNPCGEYTAADGTTAYYNNQTDNYHQQHYQLHWNQLITDALNLNVALHYTHGLGYYEQYKTDQKLYKYALSEDVGSRSDLIRRKKMDNDFYGTVLSLNYKKNNLEATVGGGWNKYDGGHYGNVIWVRQSLSPSALEPVHKYYDNNAHKQDLNVYGKVNWQFLPTLSAFADMQYRYVGYTMRGPSDQYDGTEQINYNMATHFNFFNPKAGLLWNISDAHLAYFSVAHAHKEPTRNDYEDNIYSTNPKAERLTDFELGYKFRSSRFSAGVNFYYMLYKDQFVLTGEQNAIGEMIARNVGDSYRRGVEVEAAWKPFDFFEWDVNATWSHNRAKNLKFLLDDTQEYYNVKSAPLTFSPDVILNNMFKVDWKGFSLSTHTQYVTEQYMTNTSLRSYNDNGKDVSLMLGDYFVTNLDLSYSFSHLKFCKSLSLGVSFYNLFGEKYESFGAAYTAVKSDGKGGMQGYQDADWNSYSVYSVQAPTHFLVHLSIEF